MQNKSPYDASKPRVKRKVIKAIKQQTPYQGAKVVITYA